MEIEPKHIVTLNLKYGATARPLRTVAFAQLCAKALYAHTKPVGVDHLRAEIAQLLGVPNVAVDQVERGLAYLEEIGQIYLKGGKWALTPDARSGIAAELAAAVARIDGVIRRHFPGTISRDILLAWFNEASAAVFGHYGDDWVASVCKLRKKPRYELFSLRKCLDVANKACGLTDKQDELARAYLAFLDSDDTADHACLMGLGQAMFSARLVAADLGAEPTTIDAFRSAKLILDTNLLFALALEDHRLARSVNALGNCLRRIGVTPVFLETSRDEYLTALYYKRKSIADVIRDFQPEVLSGVRDDFVSSALSRGCACEEDFNLFFDSLSTLPDQICEGLPIQLSVDDLTTKAIEAAHKDTNLQSAIGAFATRLRPYWRKPKSENSVRHDASLIHVVRAERALGNKCWVISLDRSLQACGVDVAGNHEMPAVVSIDSLIEILAVEGAGPDVDAGDFGPLLGRMIVRQCEPATNTYSLIDLEWLGRINQNARDLSPEKAIEIAKQVATQRARGKKVDSTALELDVNRMLQVEFTDIDTAVRDSIARANSAEKLAGREVKMRKQSEHGFVEVRAREIRRKAADRLALGLLWRVPVMLGACILVWLGTRSVSSNASTNEIVQWVSTSIALLGVGWGLVWRRLEHYRFQRASADECARKELAARHQPD